MSPLLLGLIVLVIVAISITLCLVFLVSTENEHESQENQEKQKKLEEKEQKDIPPNVSKDSLDNSTGQRTPGYEFIISTIPWICVGIFLCLIVYEESLISIVYGSQAVPLSDQPRSTTSEIPPFTDEEEFVWLGQQCIRDVKDIFLDELVRISDQLRIPKDRIQRRDGTINIPALRLEMMQRTPEYRLREAVKNFMLSKDYYEGSMTVLANSVQKTFVEVLRAGRYHSLIREIVRGLGNENLLRLDNVENIKKICTSVATIDYRRAETCAAGRKWHQSQNNEDLKDKLLAWYKWYQNDEGGPLATLGAVTPESILDSLPEECYLWSNQDMDTKLMGMENAILDLDGKELEEVVQFYSQHIRLKFLEHPMVQQIEAQLMVDGELTFDMIQFAFQTWRHQSAVDACQQYKVHKGDKWENVKRFCMVKGEPEITVEKRDAEVDGFLNTHSGEWERWTAAQRKYERQQEMKNLEKKDLLYTAAMETVWKGMFSPLVPDKTVLFDFLTEFPEHPLAHSYWKIASPLRDYEEVNLQLLKRLMKAYGKMIESIYSDLDNAILNVNSDANPNVGPFPPESLKPFWQFYLYFPKLEIYARRETLEKLDNFSSEAWKGLLKETKEYVHDVLLCDLEEVFLEPEERLGKKKKKKKKTVVWTLPEDAVKEGDNEKQRERPSWMKELAFQGPFILLYLRRRGRDQSIQEKSNSKFVSTMEHKYRNIFDLNVEDQLIYFGDQCDHGYSRLYDDSLRDLVEQSFSHYGIVLNDEIRHDKLRMAVMKETPEFKFRDAVLSFLIEQSEEAKTLVKDTFEKLKRYHPTHSLVAKIEGVKTNSNEWNGICGSIAPSLWLKGLFLDQVRICYRETEDRHVRGEDWNRLINLKRLFERHFSEDTIAKELKRFDLENGTPENQNQAFKNMLVLLGSAKIPLSEIEVHFMMLGMHDKMSLPDIKNVYNEQVRDVFFEHEVVKQIEARLLLNEELTSDMIYDIYMIWRYAQVLPFCQECLSELRDQKRLTQHVTDSWNYIIKAASGLEDISRETAGLINISKMKSTDVLFRETVLSQYVDKIGERRKFHEERRYKVRRNKQLHAREIVMRKLSDWVKLAVKTANVEFPTEFCQVAPRHPLVLSYKELRPDDQAVVPSDKLKELLYFYLLKRRSLYEKYINDLGGYSKYKWDLVPVKISLCELDLYCPEPKMIGWKNDLNEETPGIEESDIDKALESLREFDDPIETLRLFFGDEKTVK